MSAKQVAEWAREVGAISDVLLHGRHDNVVFTSGEILRFAELVAAKAGEVMRERCGDAAEDYNGNPGEHDGTAIGHLIRDLPGVTMEDLK